MIARSAEQEPPPRVELTQPAAGLFRAPGVGRRGECQEPCSSVLGLLLGRPLSDARRLLPASGGHQEEPFVYERILVDAQPPSSPEGILRALDLIGLERRAPHALEHRVPLVPEPDRVVAESEPDPGEQRHDYEGAADEGGFHVGRV